jgi:hypothetical protein
MLIETIKLCSQTPALDSIYVSSAVKTSIFHQNLRYLCLKLPEKNTDSITIMEMPFTGLPGAKSGT